MLAACLQVAMLGSPYNTTVQRAAAGGGLRVGVAAAVLVAAGMMTSISFMLL